ncbi:MAG: hypothetical protein IPN81_14430 [Nitrosomonadales bacterium]|nr:hypothetical protein [Nitrosomonadales bacterium]
MGHWFDIDLIALEVFYAETIYFVCLISLISTLPAHAMSVLPLYLDEIINDAAIAFQGKSLENHSERDPQTNLIVTYSTFEVQEVLKGKV